MPRPLTIGAILDERGNTFSSAFFPRYLDKPEGRHSDDLTTFSVRFQFLAQHPQKFGIMLFFVHIDKIDDYYPRDVPEPQLLCDLHRREKIGFINRFFEVRVACELARIHVDNRHRFRFVYDDIRAVFERNGRRKHIVHAFRKPVITEHIDFFVV